MIKSKLMGIVPESKKYILANVVAQWIGLCINIVILCFFAGMMNDIRINQYDYLIRNITIILTAILLRVACVKLAANASYHASRNVKRTLRGMIYKKILRIGTSYTEHISTGEVVQLAGEGVEQLETYFGSYLPQFFYAMLAPLTLFVIVSQINLTVAVILFVCVPLIPLSIVVVQNIAKRLLKKYWGQYAALGDNFLENLQGLTTLKIYQADERRHKEMNQAAEHFRIVTMKVLTMQLNSIIIMDIFAYGGAALGIALAVMAKNAGQIDFLGCFVIILLSAEFFLPMRKLGSLFHVAMSGMAASDKIFELLEIPEAPHKDAMPTSNELIITDLHYAYTKENEIIHGIHMGFPEGSFTAIVGESGCGKSTVAAILMGRNKGYSGFVSFGEKELSSISESEIMKRITLVSHNSYLFKGTVKDNLLMGNPNATDAELWETLEKVNLSDFLRCEGGLHYQLTEGASNLSNGQRQRLALARALLHNTPLYIFDEPSSNIDVESENDIMKIIQEMAHTKTVILISHRLANVVNSDNIYVMETGNIVQSGTHQELLAQGGIYKTLWDGQQSLENLTSEGQKKTGTATMSGQQPQERATADRQQSNQQGDQQGDQQGGLQPQDVKTTKGAEE